MTSKSMHQQTTTTTTTTEIPFDESAIGVPNQLCSVCGDASTGIHFGGNSCESCKAFFRRSVQCNRYQNYKCSNEERCPVNIVTRKVCQFCRYTKCTKIGMKPKWVLSDQEREEKYGPRRKRFRESRVPDEDPDIYKFLTKEEKLLIEDIAHALYQSRATYPLQFPSQLKTYLSTLSSGTSTSTPTSTPTSNSTEKPPNPSANFLVIPIQRFVLFSRMLKDFNLFTEDDKVNLLKSSAVEIIVCSSSSLFDPQSQTFTNYISRDQRAMLDEQIIPLDPILKRLWGEDLFNRTKHFLISMCQLHVDEVTTTLLVPLLLFSPDRSNIVNLDLVKTLQIKYAQLVLKYMRWRYGVDKAEQIYPKLLLQMIHIRSLSAAHGEIIQKVMSTSSVNPLVQEVTAKPDLFATNFTRSRENEPVDIGRNSSSIDNESQMTSDEEETNRNKSRQSIDEDLSQNDSPGESNPRNIWKRNEKFDTNVQNEITNVKQVLNEHLKEKSSSSLSSSSNPPSVESTTSRRRPHDHQVPNFAASPIDESTMLNKSVRHLPPKKQTSIAHRDSFTAVASPSTNGMNEFYQSSPAPSTPRQYSDVPSPQIKADLSSLSIDGSPRPQSYPIVTQLAAEERQLLDAIHAHPNKRDLVLNLLRQLNESSSASSPSSPMGFNIRSPPQ